MRQSKSTYVQNYNAENITVWENSSIGIELTHTSMTLGNSKKTHIIIGSIQLNFLLRKRSEKSRIF